MDDGIAGVTKAVSSTAASWGDIALDVAGSIFMPYIAGPDAYMPEGEGFDEVGDVASANPKKKKPQVMRKEQDNRNKQLREGAFLGTLHLPMDYAGEFSKVYRAKSNEESTLEKLEGQLEAQVPGSVEMEYKELRKNQKLIEGSVPKKVQKEKDVDKKKKMTEDFVKKILDMKKQSGNLKRTIQGHAKHLEQLAEDHKDSKTTLQSLIEQDADINSEDQEGFTALMLAARNGHLLSVKALLQFPKLDSNKTNQYGANAMHYAAMYAHREVVMELRNHPTKKVNRKVKNAAGKTPNELAKDELKDLQEHKESTWLKVYKERNFVLVPEMGKKDTPDDPIYNALGIHAPASVEPPKAWKPDRWRISKIKDPACKRDEPYTEKEFLKRWHRAAKQC
mmetsp:Transcript_25567/g.51993  ORF Transcript_25567/g.51993 Transcript_25567/m.51993 type:complete len:393 (-) Transcript_25567:276-1454(-)|eukprot:CAMPEP_0181322586 /NCGR_PEP_ID=MMETSP1101-20121128/19308_1 /TAXON_ID=46948 /ORGANISM="Rhodomonas abbreviata, Strain Caron Lab Isolate" /LENGTH=392 /DNA_ID=CAMNT_0023430511 /DNA_START=296 /DNA_END=1474 /DNA_ORIENTATION=-